MNGFPPAVIAIVAERSSGVCEVCGAARANDRHHRRPRGMGSTKRPETNLASAALDVCRPCHNVIESHRNLATLLGWLVPQGFNPETQPCLRRGDWVFLENSGGWRYSDDDFGDFAVYPPSERVVKANERYL